MASLAAIYILQHFVCQQTKHLKLIGVICFSKIEASLSTCQALIARNNEFKNHVITWYLSDLSDTQRELQATARKFTREEIIPKAAEYDISGEFPWDIMKKAFNLGLLNSFVPEKYGKLHLIRRNLLQNHNELHRCHKLIMTGERFECLNPLSHCIDEIIIKDTVVLIN